MFRTSRLAGGALVGAVVLALSVSSASAHVAQGYCDEETGTVQVRNVYGNPGMVAEVSGNTWSAYWPGTDFAFEGTVPGCTDETTTVPSTTPETSPPPDTTVPGTTVPPTTVPGSPTTPGPSPTTPGMDTDVLPATGSATGPLAALALVLLGGGILAAVVSVRRPDSTVAD